MFKAVDTRTGVDDSASLDNVLISVKKFLKRTITSKIEKENKFLIRRKLCQAYYLDKT